MSETDISVVSSKELVTLFGTCDQHVRKIREALSVSISTRDGLIHVQGEKQAVASATQVLEELLAHAQQHGELATEDIDRVLAGVQTGENDPQAKPNAKPLAVFTTGRQIRARTQGQARYIESIAGHDVVLCYGPAGTGKTYLAVATAVAALRAERVRKLVLVRPAVEAGESLGFLPGDLQAKINPYLRPLMDALHEMMDHDQIMRYREQDLIEVIPLAYMRGRTLNEAFIILDEAQNTSVSQMKMFLTRMGNGSKIVASGDTTQIDLPEHTKSGLVDALDRLQGIEGVACIKLGRGDIVRHPLVQKIVNAYEHGPPQAAIPHFMKVAVTARSILMANGGQRRTRSERVAALELPPGHWERAWIRLCDRDVLSRMALALAAAVAVCAIVRAWDPPIHWRTGMVPTRFITARVDFEQENRNATEQARQKAREETKAIFWQDTKPLEQLRADLRNTIAELTKTETLTEKTTPMWKEFQPAVEKGGKEPKPDAEAAAFQEFRKALAGKDKLDQLDLVVAAAFAPLERRGLLADLTEKLKPFNKKTILVHTDNPAELREIEVSAVTVDPQAIRQTLAEGLNSKAIAERVYTWLEPRLLHSSKPLTTFTLDVDASKAAQEESAAKVEPSMIPYRTGDTMVRARESINEAKLELLKLEYAAFLDHRPLVDRLSRGSAVLAVIFAMFTLCGMYMRYRQRGIQAELDRLAGALGLAVLTVAVAVWTAADPWRAEPVGLILFGMTVAIAYRQELALLFTGVVSWIVVLAMGGDLPMFLLLFGTTSAAVLNLGRIRTRSKLIYVGLFAGGVAALLDLAGKMIDNRTLDLGLLREAGHQFLWATMAGFFMTGLLPFVERLFGVLTDLSLLELGDITHPVLQELVRRAPSTYNHSITVGSIAEAAADAIGTRGLLCRVGAYFHDIGKMLKPGYFVENQGKDGSRHDGLVPAMSTLVIIAHIKDGADLARQHHLPQPIIDMIQQHHGTMLMEYFYDRAHTQQAADPNSSEIDENLFRYPGPKPQTKEAAVLMLADAVESASRTLVDPTPGRIEGLVRDLAQRRLQGGQFDESGLTLRELGAIERSLAMSVASIYHGRLKYPDQRSA